MLIRVVDTETTGFPPHASTVQIGWTDVFVEPSTKSYVIGNTWQHYTKPKHPIQLDAMTIHGIMEEDVANAPPLDEFIRPKPGEVGNPGRHLYIPEVKFVVAHNAAFDMQFVPSMPDIDWICTLICSRELIPQAPNHKNQFLRYYLKLPLDRQRETGAHGAGADSYVTAGILVRLLEATSLERLLEIMVHSRYKLNQSTRQEVQPNQTQPQFINSDGIDENAVCEFGQNKGKAWRVIPSSYMEWLVQQSWVRPNVLKICKYWIQKRKQGNQGNANPQPHAGISTPGTGSASARPEVAPPSDFTVDFSQVQGTEPSGKDV